MKTDDSSLNPEQLRTVEKRAAALLDRADAWGVFPTPIEDILEAAQLNVAPTKAFDPAAILSYIAGKAASVGRNLKSALDKVLGIYDAGDKTIHIDETVSESKQTFLKLHETGHHELPHHKKTFRIFQDSNQSLSADIAELFEREANNFARYALFQGDGYACMAADCPMAIKTPMKLAKETGASIYASAREFARTNHRECLVIALNPAEFSEPHGLIATVRRFEASRPFLEKFDLPNDTAITPDHALGALLPIGKQRMVRPTEFVMLDRNGDRHECVGESFKTPYNILILIYTKRALTKTTSIMTADVQPTSHMRTIV